MRGLRRASVLFAALVLALSAAAAAPPQKASKKAPASKTATSQPAGALIDINSASEQELKELPGVGDAYAKKIVDNRPYRAKTDLVRRKVIPQATYDKIKDRIIAHQGKKQG